MDDITSVLMLLSGWIPAMVLIAFLIINKKMRFGFFQGFKKKLPIIDFIHPTSQRTKSVIARFNPENEKELILSITKSEVGMPVKNTLAITSRPILDEGGTPHYLAIWGDDKTLTVDFETKEIGLADQEGNKIDFLRIFELVYAWLSLGKKPQDNLTKLLLILVIVVIGVLAINGFLTYELLQKVAPAPAMILGV